MAKDFKRKSKRKYRKIRMNESVKPEYVRVFKRKNVRRKRVKPNPYGALGNW